MPPTTRASKRRAIEGPLATPEPSHIATAYEGDAYVESSTECPDAPESEVEPDPKPTRKRARSTQKGKAVLTSKKTPKRPKVKGKLGVFKNVPVEVFDQQCGKYAPRHMDSMLLVRLCTSCREEQFKLIPLHKITDYNLIPESIESDPHHYHHLILSSDVEAVESKLKELTTAGDKGDLSRWREEHVKALKNRYTNAKLFTAWFAAKDRAREREINRLKDAHEAEGPAYTSWVGAEGSPTIRRKQQKTMVIPSDEVKAWDKLFPRLLVHLESNKRYRLSRERADRRRDRMGRLHDLWYATKKQWPPFLQATPRVEDTKTAVFPAMDDNNKLNQSFPEIEEWPEFLLLLEEDITGDELKIKLLGKQDSFNAFVRKWRDQLEEELIQQLPDHIELPNFNAEGLSLTSNAQPVNSLSAGVQRLLRADVIFKKSEYDSCCFYPEDFQEHYNMTPGRGIAKYDFDLSAIATDLLRVLGRSEATYLEMKSLGHVFQCGKCPGQCGFMSWKNLVRHYAAKKSQWEKLSKKLASLSSEDFTYIFTHDTSITMEKSNKPLVRVKQSEAPAPPMYTSYTPDKVCLVCKTVGIDSSGAYMTDHVRDVHSIEEPELGRHFK
ncbi:unnamed protein product [Rhizoctonia solani]|uniref:Uncharacterized protein n=1 Tax=Rhizoctonia solani TaxID=456999 RepID=A0A8H3E1Y3_9AGAM|nr:unnamed protein product [Rhizoctonia solani]